MAWHHARTRKRATRAEDKHGQAATLLLIKLWRAMTERMSDDRYITCRAVHTSVTAVHARQKERSAQAPRISTTRDRPIAR